MLFTTLVFSVATLHLVWRAVDYVSKWSGKTDHALKFDEQSRNKRDDWYVFFRTSDLTGKIDSHSTTGANSDRTSSRSSGKREKARRPSARIHVS